MTTLASDRNIDAGRVPFGYGTTGDDVITVRKIDDDLNEVTINGETVLMSDAQLQETSFYLLDGNDTFTADSSVTADLDVIGGEGDDDITGGSGNDRLTGGSGTDFERVAGNDYVRGGAGTDYIGAVYGENDIDGGAGEDVIYDGGARGDGKNTLHDFDSSEDTVQRENPDAVDGDRDSDPDHRVERRHEDCDHDNDGGNSGDSGDSDFDIQNLTNTGEWEYVGDGYYQLAGDEFDIELSQPDGEGEFVDTTFYFNEGSLEGANVSLRYAADGEIDGVTVDAGDSDLSRSEVQALERYFNGDRNWDRGVGNSRGNDEFRDDVESDAGRAKRDAQDALRDMVDDEIYGNNRKKRRSNEQQKSDNGSGGTGQATEADGGNASEDNPNDFQTATDNPVLEPNTSDGRGQNLSSEDSGDSSWFLTLAKIMGKLLNEKADKITDLLDEIKEQGDDPPYELTAQFQAQTQVLSYLQQAFTTAINTLGDVINRSVTAGGAAR
jgi:hypothetical protein